MSYLALYRRFRPDTFSKVIGQELMRGVSLLNVTGGYTGAKRKMIMCSLRPFEVSTLYSIIERYDEKAFIIVTEVGEILGEGFKKIN